ncbi:hypothetical protein MRB53_000466 [Persea americana]|uniref:Uncharacterized protein n=1 Tax=Persea americana TaxID=3435 RepID=A0ACC2MPW8_PERAE|nr:hypothetical protein MRB53_000466 [Persea americana]
MAPGRKKGANRKKTKNPLSLGDLVLAKVKGFPAWPAKIGRPEDWERSPDPRNYFVEFFGTCQIAFVAAANIQAFTSETRSRLVARCQGKTVKDFSRAVKEICEAFEELQQKKTGGSGDDIDSTATGCMASNVGREDDKHLGHRKDAGLKDECRLPEQKRSDNIEGLDDEEHGLERRSLSSGDTVSKDLKDCISQKMEYKSSPVLIVKKKTKPSNQVTHSPDNGIVSNTQKVSCSSPDKGEIYFKINSGNGEGMTTECGKAYAHSNGSGAAKRDGLLDGEEDSPIFQIDGKDGGSPPLAISFHAKCSGGRRVIESDGEKKMAPEPRRKIECAVELHKKISADPE